MATTTPASTALPPVVSRQEWQRQRDAFLVKEKAHMRAGDALMAERRRLPAVEVTKSYTFDSTGGKVSLLDLFEGRSQLIVYNFMFAPGDGVGCTGCSMVADYMGPDAHLNARDVSRVLISHAPLPELLAYQQRMGWKQRWVSSFESDFNRDFHATTDEGEDGRFNVFLRDGDRILHTHDITNRGTESFVTVFTYLDLAPYGRQEFQEDSPAGWPQSEPFSWWRRHDEYEDASPEAVCCH
jgi:predicted dithiol-disulfide oxidoreductase (DUF899 family)